MINVLVLEISLNDFLLDAAKLHKCQFCATINELITQSAKMLASVFLTEPLRFSKKVMSCSHSLRGI